MGDSFPIASQSDDKVFLIDIACWPEEDLAGVADDAGKSGGVGQGDNPFFCIQISSKCSSDKLYIDSKQLIRRQPWSTNSLSDARVSHLIHKKKWCVFHEWIMACCEPASECYCISERLSYLSYRSKRTILSIMGLRQKTIMSQSRLLSVALAAIQRHGVAARTHVSIIRNCQVGQGALSKGSWMAGAGTWRSISGEWRFPRVAWMGILLFDTFNEFYAFIHDAWQLMIINLFQNSIGISSSKNVLFNVKI